jgi:hypothetical protein
MKRRLEEEFCYTDTISNDNEILVTNNNNNRKFVIKINNDNDDLLILYSRYPSTEHEISSTNQIIGIQYIPSLPNEIWINNILIEITCQEYNILKLVSKHIFNLVDYLGALARSAERFKKNYNFIKNNCECALALRVALQKYFTKNYI